MTTDSRSPSFETLGLGWWSVKSISLFRFLATRPAEVPGVDSRLADEIDLIYPADGPSVTGSSVRLKGNKEVTLLNSSPSSQQKSLEDEVSAAHSAL